MKEFNFYLNLIYNYNMSFQLQHTQAFNDNLSHVLLNTLLSFKYQFPHSDQIKLFVN